MASSAQTPWRGSATTSRWMRRSGFLILAVGAVILVYRQFAPLWLERTIVVSALYVGRVAYPLLVLGSALVLGAAIVGAVWWRARRRAWQPALRWAVPAAAVLAMVLPIELVAGRVLRWSHRLPELPTRFDAAEANARGRTRNIVVIGESSARGEPYDFSVAQIAAWQLERVFPDTRFDVTMLARGGLSLEDSLLYLVDLRQRPDAVVIYSGHNEFQARYRWSRTVAYYDDDGPSTSASLLPKELTRRSALQTLLEQALERHRLERPPPPRATRELVDRPAYTADEYTFLRDDYRLRLDHVLAWCQRIGALPIVIVPAGNDVDFPPSRSFLDPTASREERQRFADDFTTARALEQESPDRAREAYRALIERQPLFAEAHYRYAKLLAVAGAPAEDHFVRARDLDGMPMRMPGDFQAAARQAARDHNAILIDTQRILNADQSGDLFHDGQHPTLDGYVAIAQDLLEQLRARRAFGWPESTPVPKIDPVECAIQFKLDTQQWARICRRSSDFYGRIAYIRYDPSPHLARAAQYEAADKQIEAGQFDDVAGLGINLAALQKAATTVTAAAAVPPPGATPADPAVAAACRATAAGLVSGDRSAFESLPPETRSEVMQRGSLEGFFFCLAVASDDSSYCDQLPQARRNECAQQWQFMHELKPLPAPTLKAQVLYRLCLGDNDKSDCDHVVNAIVLHDASECAGLAKPPMRSFCAALAAGDTTKCDALEVTDQRSMCAAFASDDASHCPKEEGHDCVTMARAFATWKLAEPGAAEDMDPVGAALRWGKPAYCAPLLADFERVCAERG